MTTHLRPDAALKMTIGNSLSRADFAALTAEERPIRLLNCGLKETDLSNIDVIGWRFGDCILKRADFTMLKFVEATIEKYDFHNGKFRGAISRRDQAGVLLAEMGLKGH